jgi:hypothetical protein
MIKRRIVKLDYIETSKQQADIFTKVLPGPRHLENMREIGLREEGFRGEKTTTHSAFCVDLELSRPPDMEYEWLTNNDIKQPIFSQTTFPQQIHNSHDMFDWIALDRNIETDDEVKWLNPEIDSIGGCRRGRSWKMMKRADKTTSVLRKGRRKVPYDNVSILQRVEEGTNLENEGISLLEDHLENVRRCMDDRKEVTYTTTTELATPENITSAFFAVEFEPSTHNEN